MDPRLTPIRRILLGHRNPYPPDDLITTYKDFVREREFLHLYQYNHNVFVSLVDMADRLWEAPGRINRPALVTAIKRYGFRERSFGPYQVEPTIERPPFDMALRKKLFRLFRRAFETTSLVPAGRREDVISYCNTIIHEFTFESEEEQWMLDNINRSPFIQTRVLRYPGRSGLISAWARKHYDEDAYRTWRPMLAARIIDEDPDFEVTRKTLLEDFEYLNRTDIAAIASYDAEYEAAQAIEEQLGEFMPSSYFPEEFMHSPPKHKIHIPSVQYPELNLSRRFYQTPKEAGRRPLDHIPDIEKLREQFYLNIGFTQRNTMLWALAYSNLDEPAKFERLKKFYGDDTHRTFVRICERRRYYGLLEWVEEQLRVAEILEPSL